MAGAGRGSGRLGGPRLQPASRRARPRDRAGPQGGRRRASRRRRRVRSEDHPATAGPHRDRHPVLYARRGPGLAVRPGGRPGLSGAPDDDLVAGLQGAGAGRVVLTRGAGGALAADREETVDIPGEPVSVVDVTGGGDALVAGTITGLVEGADFADPPSGAGCGSPPSPSPSPGRCGPTSPRSPARRTGHDGSRARPDDRSRGRRDARRGWRRRRPRVDDHHPWDAVSGQPRDRPRRRAGGPRPRRGPGHDRGRRRPAAGGPRARRAREAGERQRGRQGQPARPPGRGGVGPQRGHDCGGHYDPCPRRGHAVFATGGIGGVHRGAGRVDISADLPELARTPVTVVCSGAKSILDLPRTLEVLETAGVPVLGSADRGVPGVLHRSSGLPVDHRVDTPEQLAAVVAAHRELGLRGGILVANPVPEPDALDAAHIDTAIDEAVADAERAGIGRHALTPYLLARIVELTGGRSLAANVALVRNNAALAARTAVVLAATPSS